MQFVGQVVIEYILYFDTAISDNAPPHKQQEPVRGHQQNIAFPESSKWFKLIGTVVFSVGSEFRISIAKMSNVSYAVTTGIARERICN